MEALLADMLATHRIVRLIQDDLITERPREALKRWLYRQGLTRARGLLDCPFCLSVHIGFAVATARVVAPRTWGWAARALAASDVAGLISQVV